MKLLDRLFYRPNLWKQPKFRGCPLSQSLSVRFNRFQRRIFSGNPLLSLFYVFITYERAQAQVLGKQVLRSGTSIGANYHEAYRGRSKAEFIAKCGDCLREIEETAYWLELLVDAGILSAQKMQPLRSECDELRLSL